MGSCCMHKTKQQKKPLRRRKSYNSVLTFNPGLVLTAFRTIVPYFQQVNQTRARDPALGQRSTSKTRDLDEQQT